jgi:hypothetical protein
MWALSPNICDELIRHNRTEHDIETYGTEEGRSQHNVKYRINIFIAILYHAIQI